MTAGTRAAARPRMRTQLLVVLAACTTPVEPELETIAGPPPALSPEVRQGFVLETPAYYGVVPADYDGDGKADLAIKLDGGTWQIDYAANGLRIWDEAVNTGVDASWVPVRVDYDGDHKADLAVVKDSHWL